MHHYTIKPVLNILSNSAAKESYKLGDIEQIENKIKKILTKKLANKHQKDLISSEERYLKIIKAVKNHVKNTGAITKEALIKIIDREIKKEGLYYLSRKHAAAHDNVFSPLTFAQENIKPHYYDIAFYNRLYKGRGKFHHHSADIVKFSDSDIDEMKKLINNLKETTPAKLKNEFNEVLAGTETAFKGCLQKTEEKNSVFYIRCEEFEDNILIGNMQIDCSKKGRWGDKDAANILMKKKNIYQIMIQEAINYAIKKRRKKILFQSGSAVEISQWYDERYYFRERTLITEKNLAAYKKFYNQALEEFDNYKKGDIINEVFADWLIIEKDSKKLEKYSLNHSYLIPLVYILTTFHGFRKSITEKDITKKLIKDYITRKTIKNVYADWFIDDLNSVLAETPRYDKMLSRQRGKTMAHLALYNCLKYCVKIKDAEKTLFFINKIFDCLIKIDFDKQKNEKISYLNNLFQSHRLSKGKAFNDNDSYGAFELFKSLEVFLLEFGYHQILLEKYKKIKPVKLNKKTNKVTVKFIIDRNDIGGEIKSFSMRNAIKLPVKGRYLYYDAKEKNYMSRFLGYDGREKIYNWYEETIPEILKNLNISYKKTTIYTQRYNENEKKNKIIECDAWEVTTPKKDLKDNLILVF